ncbi:hypothetical protein D3C79_657340 [compost metagenome]
MARMTATIVCRQSWWLKYYLAGVLAMPHITGREPDLGRVFRWIERGIKGRGALMARFKTLGTAHQGKRRLAGQGGHARQLAKRNDQLSTWLRLPMAEGTGAVPA